MGGRRFGAWILLFKERCGAVGIVLQQYAIDKLIREGFTPTITPDLARNEILSGIGFIPRGTRDADLQRRWDGFEFSGDGGDYAGRVNERHDFRSGANADSDVRDQPLLSDGSRAHGKAARGLYRVHQFTKVEMFAFTQPEDSDKTLEDFCRLECEIFDGLGIPYRVIDTASGDLGGQAYRKFDLEAWMPGRGENGEFGEVTSTSNCTDYQSRRLGIRYKLKGEKGTHFVHTLNGTAVAISRGIIAVLENYQQADGSVIVPEVLRKWMGKDCIVPAK